MIGLAKPLAAALLALLPVPQSAEPPDLSAWVPSARLRVLQRIGTDLAKLGREVDVHTLEKVLQRFGETPGNLERAKSSWAKHLKGEPGSFRRAAGLIGRVEKEVERLCKPLADMPAVEREFVAETILLLDSQCEPAHETLGHVQARDGRWLTADALTLEAGGALLHHKVQLAREIEVDITVNASTLPAILNLYDEGLTVSADGVALHGAQGEQVLRRILLGTLQGLALSQAIRGHAPRVPELNRSFNFLLLDSQGRYDTAQREAVENLGLSASQIPEIRGTNQLSFQDKRGWRTSTWRTEADLQAFLLWMVLREVLGDGAQPCLTAGHINWIALTLYGTTLPNVAWRDPSAGQRTLSSAPRLDGRAVWRSAQRGLFGCRSWMIELARKDQDPPWWKAMVDQLGKIQNEVLFKTTLVHEFLACTGELQGLLDETRAEDERVQAFEAALNTELPSFEERWSRWLVGTNDGVLQRLRRVSAVENDTQTQKLLRQLNELRALAFHSQRVEFKEVREAPDLSAGARAHARYLGENEAQREWPEVHEEFIDRPGFSAEGSRAGLSSVIAFTDSSEDALRQWMGTFYHRLPLLDPSLFGVGFAVEQHIAVLDCLSLRTPHTRDTTVLWPPDGMSGVPTHFVPESPNPVPGSNQNELGYPITVQIFRAAGEGSVDLKLRLKTDRGEEVECYELSPEQALFEELVPANAWCLIPKHHLKSSTSYRVFAERGGRRFSWSFRTASR